MVESLLGGNKAEADRDSFPGSPKVGSGGSPGATTGKTAVAAKSAGGKQVTPSVLEAATSVFKPVTKFKPVTPSDLSETGRSSGHRSFGGGGARLKAEATKRRIRSTVVSSAVFRSLAPNQLEAVIDAMEEVRVAKGETIIRQVALVVVAVVVVVGVVRVACESCSA